ncbi:DUF1648 domain-containing protein [Galactobacter valiniphilus]|uniref:DUF1648 domain-containing protein n=1 Tax=Galactobacter valiniphilus TaxID=2676122 RepID=UPI001314625B|nr:DUF1648 domain-containing protein [Galactobacter valiniphilus]
MNARTPSPARTAPRGVARRRYVLVALVAPVALLLIVAATQLLLIPDLGATVPTHWGPNGVVDGWGPAWTAPALTAGIGVGTVVLVGGLGLSGLGQASGTGAGQKLRFLAAITVWSAVFLAGCLGTTGVGMDADGQELGPRLLIGMLGGAALGGLAAWWAYRVTWDVAGDRPAVEPIPAILSDGAPATWERTVAMSRGMWAILAGVVLITVGIVFLGSTTTEPRPLEDPRFWWTAAGLAALLLAIGLTTSSARVRVDASGLTVRGTIGLPRMSVAAEQVEKAEVLPVSAVGQFGGWGWRYFPGSGWGVIMKSGEALVVTKKNGGSLTVTVDDAARAASLLGAYAERAGAAGAPGGPGTPAAH